MSFFSKFKQQFVELFDKEKKTVDENIDKKLAFVSDFESNLVTYQRNIDSFCQTALLMLESHANLNEMLSLLYGESAFRLYITEVGRCLAQTSILRQKIESLQTTVRRMTEQTSQQVAQMKVLATERHNSRVFYDHYRGKVARLERTHSNTSDAKKHEKYARNQKKYADARSKYERDNRQLQDLLEAVTTKIEVILGEVCFRFTQEVEVRFYAEISQVFANLSDFEERMKQIALQAATGQFGKVGGKAGMDLDVQFQ